jgi:predicted nuclease of predicted toxin-antitoxin system
VQFLIDAQLPPNLAKHLSDQGHQAAHVAEIGLNNAPDREIWSHAAATGAVLITKDEDFVVMRALDSDGPAVVWVRIGNTTNRALIARFSQALPDILASLERGHTIIEISGR